MMELVYSLPYLVLEVPRLKLKRPSWLAMPSPMTVFAFILLSYFLVTGGEYVHTRPHIHSYICTHSHTHTSLEHSG